MTNSSRRQTTMVDRKNDTHYEGMGESFPKELTEAVEAVCQARELTSEKAAEEMGVTLNVFLQVLGGGTPKAARKVKAKVRAWLEKNTEDKSTE